MSTSAILSILITVVFLIAKVVRVGMAVEARRKAALPSPQRPPIRNEPKAYIAEAHAEADALLKRANALVDELRNAAPQVKIVRDILAYQVIPEIERASGVLAAPAEISQVAIANASVSLGKLRVAVVGHVAHDRAHPQLGPHLADADTLADALLRPLVALHDEGALHLPSQRPVCVPAAPDEESVWFGILPEGYPLIFVPQNFGDDLFRWASLPHEIGHLVWRALPNFSHEVRRGLGLSGSPTLLRFDLHPDQIDLLSPFRAWLEELCADAWGTLMLGPSALRSYIECFASPREPDRVLWAGAYDDQTYAPHPPSHLRVLLSGVLLEEMGYDVEAKALVTEWQTRHGNPERLFLPALPQAVALPVGVMLEIGADLIKRLYRASYPSLGGRELRSIHGLELSPGLRARVQARSRELADGHPVRDDPRVILAAAIEARTRGSAASTKRIAHAVMSSVLGRDTDERRPGDRNWETNLGSARTSSRPSLWGGVTADDVRGALVLRQILGRRFSDRL